MVLLRRLRLPFAAVLSRLPVAVHSNPVVATEQLAPGQGSWEEEVSRWRAQLRGSVVKEEHESRPTSVRDVDLAVPNPGDARRLDIVADGLPLFGGAQLTIDTTLISSLHCDGTARPGTADTDGAALTAARRRKERTYPELVGPRGRARLVVLAGKVGGRWSAETMSFLSQMAKAKTRHEPRILRQRVQQAWRSRWQAILSCAAAKAFARSLLEMRAAVGADGDTPASHDVLRDFQGPAEWG